MPAKRFSHDGIDFALADEGSGPVVLLVHGFPLDRTMWNDQVAALAASHRVLAPDLRGFGDSAIGPDDAANGVAMETYAADLIALLDAAGVQEPVVLAGFSMGGYVAWQFALRYPQRLRALIACDTRAVADSDEAAANRLEMAAAVLAAGDAGPAQLMIPKLLAPRTLELGGPVVP
ncbi:MAG: alpha/beta fold hydrolase, partial [Planctomycetales bacterium]|nr:alpha/beta fold hydrolase [Planctomycetales bacterium]